MGAAGAGIFPHVIGNSLIGFLEQSSRFLKPVFCGDTLYPLLEVSDLKAGRTAGVVTMKLTIPQSVPPRWYATENTSTL